MRVPNELLREEIIVEDYEGSGARGPIFGAARKVRAQFQPTLKVWTERDNTGTSVSIDALVVIRPESGPIPPQSRVLLQGVKYRVIRTYAMPDARRPSHYEVALSDYATAGSGGTGSGFGGAS